MTTLSLINPEVSAAFSDISASTTATMSSLPTFKRAISTSYPRQTYYEMARAMKEEIKIKDRTYHLKTYKQCFLGSDAVSFILKYLELESREEAVEVGKELNDKIHCFEHVCGEHDLKDQKLFYRFTDSSKSQQGCLAEVLKSRKAQANEPNNSLIDDSDTEESDDEQEKDTPDLSQLLKTVDNALTQEQEASPNPQTSDELTKPKKNSRRARPRTRPGSSPHRDGSNSRKERSPRNSPRTISPKAGSRARVPRRERGASGGATQRSRSKSPQKTASNSSAVMVQRSSTFHGRGRVEARKHLHVERPGNKRINALKKKQEASHSPVRKRENNHEAAASEASEEDHKPSNKPMKERSASLKGDRSTFQFPPPIGDLPPRASSAPGRRRRSPNSSPRGRAANVVLQVKKDQDKDFLQKGHASWGGPDSDEFLLPFDMDDSQNEGHSSLTDFSLPDDPKSRPSLDRIRKPAGESKKSGRDDGKGSSRSRTSVEAKSRSSLESRAKEDASTKGSTRSRTSTESRSRSSLENKAKPEKGSNHSIASSGSKAARSSLDKGSNHSMNSAGSGRSALLTSLYSVKKRPSMDAKGSTHSTGGIETKKDKSPSDVDKRLSLREVAYQKKRASFEGGNLNDSITSALNESILGDMSDDEDFNSNEFA